MNRKLIVHMSIAVAFLFLSTAILTPQVNSKPVMDKIDYLDRKREKIKEEFNLFSSEYIQADGILEWLMQLIRTIIQLVFRLIEVVQDIMNIVNLIDNLINALQILFQLIQDLIQLIQDVIPSTTQGAIKTVKLNY